MSTTAKTPEQTAADNAAAVAAATETNAKLAAAEAENTRLKAEAATRAADDLKAANATAATECKGIIKSAFGREATEGEVTAYQGMNQAGRDAYKAAHVESAKNRADLLKRAGLTSEVVNDSGALDERHPDNNLIVQAARSLGLAPAAK